MKVIGVNNLANINPVHSITISKPWFSDSWPYSLFSHLTLGTFLEKEKDWLKTGDGGCDWRML